MITKRIVGSDYPSLFGAFYFSYDGTPYCYDANIESMEVIAFDTCLTEYVYNHVTKLASATSSIKYTRSGSGPYTVTIENFFDTDCGSLDTTVPITVSDDCDINGNGFTVDGTYGYGEFFDSFPTSPEDIVGTYQLGFKSSKCDSDPYSGYWLSLYGTLSISAYDLCTNSNKFTCENGVGKLFSYGSIDCSGDAIDSEQYSNPSNCDSVQNDDKSSGDDEFTSDASYETIYCTSGGDGYTFSPLSYTDDVAKCFAGSEAVTLESGASKLISEVVVGDRVLASTAQGAFVFSDVIAVPHAKNNDRVMFNEISLANGADIRMTGEHLLPIAASCGVDAVFTVTAAKDVAANSCVMTVDGQSAVVSNNKVAGTGIYTIVTNEEYVVVNGVVASPFAVSHAVGNTFYNVYRAMYNYVPGLLKSSFFQTFHATFASLAMKTW